MSIYFEDNLNLIYRNLSSAEVVKKDIIDLLKLMKFFIIEDGASSFFFHL